MSKHDPLFGEQRPYAVSLLTQVPTVPDDDPVEWKPIRHHFGIEAFGVNAFVASSEGELVIEDHDEVGPEHEELYLVTAGHALFTVGDEEVDAPAGTLVFVRDPSTRRLATAREPGTTVLAVGGRPGAAFERSDWERRDLGE